MAVHFQKGKHDIDANALVAIDKGVVGDQGIAEPRALFLFRGIEFLIPEAGEGSFQSRIQQALISHTYAAARGSRNWIGFIVNQMGIARYRCLRRSSRG